MQFFIHIGTEKTGSSFLQSAMTLGRTQLAHQGVWAPEGTQRSERAAARGEISAGNGERLARIIDESNWEYCSRELGNYTQEARRRRCDRVLISSERLLRPLSDPNRLAMLASLAAKKADSGLALLLVLRDPIDQVVSLYKHRAKNGRCGSFYEWVQRDYDLPQQLENLARGVDEERLGITTLGYDSEGAVLSGRFFREWLGASPPKVCLPDRINPSLKLSELAVLRAIAASDQRLVPVAYQALLAISPGSKSPDREFERRVREAAARHLCRFNNIWQSWNDRLPDGQRFHMPAAPCDSSAAIEDAACSLSAHQLETLVDLFVKSRRISFRAELWWRASARPLLATCWRRLRPRQL